MSRDALLARARALSGRTLGELADALGVALRDGGRAKGSAGELIERTLGGTAGSRGVADFPELGVELKSLPLAPDGRPRESTFVTSITPAHFADETWETSRARAKLACVLWVPVEARREGATDAGRRIGRAFLWVPDPDEEALLRADWEAHAARFALGRAEEVDATAGRALQVRPKAANASALRRGIDADGAPTYVRPMGLYLRATFTATLVRRGLEHG